MAIETADVVPMKSDPLDILHTLTVSKVLLRNVERELGTPAAQPPANSGRPAHAA